MASPNKCPTCGAPIPEGTPDGVCPRCALNGALRSSSYDGESDGNAHEADAQEPPGPPEEEEVSRDRSEDPPLAAELDVAKHALEGAIGAALPEKPGTRIGPYKLLQKIGEGGFGVVWMAEQEQPIRRRVALKILKSGMDTREVIARFEAERQALALMDHPNIARVFDAGAIPQARDGRPYFVMELVRGIPITRYCDENKLTTEARLRLFIAVCQGVQHAHQKGVVHRDLKPSNILVTLGSDVGACSQVISSGSRASSLLQRSAEATPKIIDFGIAKATSGARLTDKTLFTQFHAFVGTPAYTSPEQIEMSGLDVDTRSDIYSLGVLLYELLAGRPPFDANALAKSGLDAMRRTIREVEPPRPSRRLDTLTDAERTTVARERGTDAAKLESLLHGDLDAIAMHCLEKDRTRRYETANALASDLERHLCHEPIVARPPSRVYRTRKFIRRHRLGVGAVAAVVLSLCAGLIASAILLARERSAHRRAVASEHAESALRREADAARENETIHASRTARDLAERLLAEGRSAEGLAWLVHAARKNPRDATIAPRLASALTSRNFFLPAGPTLKFPSRVAAVHHVDGGRKIAVYCVDGTVGFIDVATGGHTRTRLPAGLKTPGVVLAGRVTIVRGDDDVIRALDPASGRIEREFTFGQKIAEIAAWNKEAPVVHAVLEDRCVVLAEAITGRTTVMPFRHAVGTATLLSPDGRWLLRPSPNSDDGEVWDVASGELHARQPNPGLPRWGNFSPDGTRMLLVYWVDASRSAFQLYSVPDLQPLIVPGELTESEFHGARAVIVCGFSADSRWFCIGSQMGQQMFETATGARVGPFVKAGIFSATFLHGRERLLAMPGGPYPASANFSPIVVRVGERWCRVTASPLDARIELTVCDLITGQPVYAPLTHVGGIVDATVSEDGSTLIGVGMDGCAILWDLHTGQRIAEPALLERGLDCTIAMTPDGRGLVIGRADGTVQRLRAGPGRARPLVLPRGSTPLPAPFLPARPTRLLWLETNRSVALDVTTGKRVAGGFEYPESIRGRGIAISPDLKFILAQTASGVWQAWELDEGRVKRMAEIEDAPQGIRWIEFSARGDLVALISRGRPESPRIWNLATGKPVGGLLTQATAVLTRDGCAACFSADGRLFACGGTDGGITLWDVATSQRVITIGPSRLEASTRLEFSPDGRCLAAGDASGFVQLWDVPSGRLRAEIPRASFAKFSPGGNFLLVGTGDTSRVCHALTGADLGEPLSHPGVTIQSAAFSADGRRVVTAAQDSTARIWDAATGLPISEPLLHASGVTGCEFSPDGQFVRTEDAEGRFVFWSVPPHPSDAPAPEWLLQLATICAQKRINEAGQCVDAPEAIAQIDAVRRALAALPDDVPFVEWGRWILDDREDRPIAPGFTITPAEAEQLEQQLRDGTAFDAAAPGS